MNKRKKVLGLAGILVLACILFLVLTSDRIAVTKDIVYGRSKGVDLKLDLAKPPRGKGPFPAVVCIHGGAWQQGGKHDLEAFMRQFARSGYVAASVDYRMAPQYKWPAQIEDVKCAVRYLRAHAKELNIDPENIFASGASAGGHLSLMLGLMSPEDGLEGDGGNPEQASSVRGVANFYGPADLRTWNVTADVGKPEPKDTKTAAQTVLEAFLGTSERIAPVVAQASPITYVHAENAPVITFHGAKDDIVPFAQATSLHEALEKAGVPQKLVPMPNDVHGWGGEKLKNSLNQAISFFDSIRAQQPAK